MLQCRRLECLEEVKQIISDHCAEKKAHHFVTDSINCDLYSLGDLISMHEGSLPVQLAELLGKLKSSLN